MEGVKLLCVSLSIICLTVHPALGYEVSTANSVVRSQPGKSLELSCTYTADFDSPRIEWKRSDLQGSTTLIYYEKQVTEKFRERFEVYDKGMRITNAEPSDSGDYMCEVTAATGNGFNSVTIKVIIEVPPKVPQISVPTSVTNGGSAELSCTETHGYPKSKYKWFRNGIPIPVKSAGNSLFHNSSYILNIETGVLLFNPVTKSDVGEYYCEASNGVGPAMRSQAKKMDVYETNVGGIVAGVIIALLIIALIGIGIWFAYRKGYLPRKKDTKPPVSYHQPPEDTTDDADFKQKSSFVV
ncbi:junctional adhesion molecule A [Callorhinchus milii]|uniref:Junctional adhesion molecule A n=1 Tax=Callorhinchus milii TaxID=7868 RepID=A0A4W3JZN4_CALMI|nr:junctional adhesion molecule A [Callorhinchus milii]|eukprot:gi/632949543/ref/XP_007890214.1/ PREDICTED: junctional adhesion molecule A-like [Callorhinchus milii]